MPTGFGPDGPPVLWTEADNSARVAGSQSFTPGSATPSVMTKATVRNDPPVVGSGSAFSTITAPSSFTHTRANASTQVPV